MASAFELQGSVKLESKEVLEGLSRVDKQIDKTGEAMEKVEGKSGKFGKVLGGVGKTLASTFALGKIKSFSEEAVQGANVQIMAETKLQNNLMATGRATMENVDSLKQYASHLQKVGVIGDEVGMAGMSQLATFNLTSDSIRTLSDGMYNLAVNQKGVNATQEDMMGYANMIGKAMQGQATALTRVGVTMSDYQKNIIETGTEQERASVIAEVLKANYGNLNEEIAKTPEGKMTQLNNDLGDMKETLGMALLPVMVQVVGWIQRLVTWFTSLSPSTQKIVMVSGLLVALLPSLIGLFSGLATVTSVLGISFSAVTLPILAIVGVITGVIAIGVALWKNWDTIKEKASQLGEWIGEKWNSIKEKTSETWNKIKLSTSEVWSKVQSKIEEHGGGIKGIIGTVVEANKESWSKGFNALDEITGGKLSSIKNKISDGLNAIKGFFSNLRLPEIKIPKIKLPHFNLTGSFSLKPPSVPKLNVDWYSEGAIFTKKTVLGNGLGVGDANKGQGNNAEGIIPLDILWDKMDKIANRPIQIFITARELARATASEMKNELNKLEMKDVRFVY
ncbi:hypothetical protein [Clostridium tertium]|jgi:hypothetical protein|uniref:hypothetical protein n=1 Tax=Clostridium tertium TaxID=1559 RepID=UPI001C1DECC8|nr:hypothetical protein [Clostridium tertium]MBU6135225.1 hypothetical protein [Clostridium tertium]